MTFERLPEEEAKFTAVLNYFSIELAEWTFYAVVVRPVSEDIMIGEGRRVTCGAARVVEGGVLRNASGDERKVIEDDYINCLHRTRQVGTPLGLGDIKEILEAQSVATVGEPQ